MNEVDRVLGVLERRGAEQYGGEAVTQIQHALQCAHLAERSGATAPLIVAALLHDIGHLVHELGEDATERGIDDRHEERGREFLATWFDKSVTEPVGLHVPAKRYLCAIDPGYHAALSPASVRSLEIQGGPLDDAGISEFLARRGAGDAVSVRRWDERAKDPGATTPDLSHFRPFVEAALRRW